MPEPAVEAVKYESFRVLRDRIFIATEIENGNVLGDWDTAVTNFEMHASTVKVFGRRFNDLNARVVKMALNPPKRIGFYRRWRDRREVAKFRASHVD